MAIIIALNAIGCVVLAFLAASTLTKIKHLEDLVRSYRMSLDRIIKENDRILEDLHNLEQNLKIKHADHSAELAKLTASQVSPATVQSLIDKQNDIRNAIANINQMVNPPVQMSEIKHEQLPAS